jgi:hypothetical protein
MCRPTGLAALQRARTSSRTWRGTPTPIVSARITSSARRRHAVGVLDHQPGIDVPFERGSRTRR